MLSTSAPTKRRVWTSTVPGLSQVQVRTAMPDCETARLPLILLQLSVYLDWPWPVVPLVTAPTKPTSLLVKTNKLASQLTISMIQQVLEGNSQIRLKRRIVQVNQIVHCIEHMHMHVKNTQQVSSFACKLLFVNLLQAATYFGWHLSSFSPANLFFTFHNMVDVSNMWGLVMKAIRKLDESACGKMVLE